ncbi:hypothetical protein [Nocardioides convexus]|uniref:hypothetical protein n=1 Tax=Nocardioides convexus TaxID=2712224 RepID=UPI00241879D1|nr:hypothetical protein [Nocardioides convexus]
MHLDTYRNPDAPVKVILLHGVGTNGRQMSLVLGRPLAERGYETIAIDMPTYGVTEVADGALVTYDDWVRLGSDSGGPRAWPTVVRWCSTGSPRAGWRPTTSPRSTAGSAASSG